jgi:hypothetical protein
MAGFGKRVKLPGTWGFILLGVWLILYGLALMADLRFDNSDVVFGALAVAAGVLVLIGK